MKYETFDVTLLDVVHELGRMKEWPFSRERAEQMIRRGLVWTDGKKCLDGTVKVFPSTMIGVDWSAE